MPWSLDKTQRFGDALRSGEMSIEVLELFVQDWFGAHRCLYCGDDLKHMEVERFKYLEWEVSRFSCCYCENTLLKVYSRDGKILSVQGLPSEEQHRNYWIKYMIGEIIHKYGSPITSSRDYVIKGKRKYDYREVDALIWKILEKSLYTKYGYDTGRIQKHVNHWFRKNLSQRLVFRRLNDLELRGLVTKTRRCFAEGIWRWFWRRVVWDEGPFGYYGTPEVMREFEDLKPFSSRVSDDLPFNGNFLAQATPQQILDAYKRAFEGEGLKSSKKKAKRVEKGFEDLEKGFYGLATPWIRELLLTSKQKIERELLEESSKSRKKN